VNNRKYDIEPSRSGVVFTCTYCGYRISTNHFQNELGNRRTQAATAMNRHIEQSHISVLMAERRLATDRLKQLPPRSFLSVVGH
jgi:hypothetical protein